MNDNLSEAQRQVLEFVQEMGGSVCLVDFDQSGSMILTTWRSFRG